MADDVSIIIGTNAAQVGQEIKGMAGSVMNAATQAKAMADAFAFLDKAMNAGKIDAQQYSKAVQMLDKAEERLYSSIGQTTAAIEKQAGAAARGTKTVSGAAMAAEKYANAQRLAGKTTNRFGMYSQQVGYQVGDFLVQVQSGTDALVAFGQQGTQLAGLLPGLAGAILGIGLSLGTAVLNAKLASQGLAFGFKRVGEDLLGALEPISPLISGIGSALSSVGSVFSRFGVALLDNLDRVVSTTIAAAAIFGGRFVAGVIAARVATMSLGGALLFLRGALIRTGIGALIVGAGELLFQFTRLIKGAGSFGEAMSLLGSVAVGVWEKIKAGGDWLEASLGIIFNNISDAWLMNVTGPILISWGKMLDQLASTKVGNLMGIEGGNEALFGDKLADDTSNLTDNFVRLNARLTDAKAALGAPISGLEELRAAMAKADEEGKSINITDWFTTKEDDDKGGGGKTAEDKLKDLVNQLRLEEELIGKTSAQQRIIKALGINWEDYGDKTLQALTKTIEALEATNKKVAEQQQIADTVSSSMETAFMSMVDGTSSVKDAFRSMARDIIAELYKVLVVQQLVGSFDRAAGTGSGIVGTIGKALFPNANGNAFFGGRVTPFANGGVVSGPTMFPMSGGQTGLMGEAGPEAIMPLKRDKNGRLGVSVGGGSGSVVVNNNINVTGGSDPAAIRMEVAKLMPQITNATKAAVIDARRRGGQMKASFG